MDWLQFNMKSLDESAYKVLYKKNTGFWTTLNDTGSEIVSLLMEGVEKKEIAQTLSEEYSLEYSDVLKDVSFFIKELTNRINKYESDAKKYKGIKEKTITIHITKRCNLKCVYCYNASGIEYTDDPLSKEEILDVIRQAKKEGFKNITFSGGEPTIREDFFEIIKEVSEKIKNINITLITNGTLKLSDEKLDSIAKYVNTIQISLDSCEEEINARTRGAGTLEKIKLFIAELLKRNFRNFYLATTPLTSEMSVTPSISTLPQMLRFATNVGAMGLYVNMLKPDGRMDYSQYKQFNIDEYWNGVHKTYEEQRRLYELGFDNIALFAGSDFNQILEGYCFSENCGLGCSELAINYDGNVYPCASLMKDDFLLGNIKEMCISDLYKKAYSIYSECTVDNMEHCKECDERYICGGGCRALAYAYSKNISGENPHCKQCKSQIHFWQLMSVNLYQKDVEND